jgi:hypothetical protein
VVSRSQTYAARANWGAVVSVFVGATATCVDARAQQAATEGPPWDMSAVNETFTVRAWGRPCGPAPTSGSSFAGGRAVIRSEGGELVIDTGERTFRTDRCLDPIPTLVAVPSVHWVGPKAWRTRCATPPGDSRRATLNTAFFLTASDALTIAETGRYEFSVKGTQCVADVTREASLRRVAPAVMPSSTAASDAATTGLPSAASHPSRIGAEDCSAPGAPDRLEVRPSRKLLRVGDHLVFRAVVLDAAGCRTATPIRWSLDFPASSAPPSPRPSIDASGELTVPSGSSSGATFAVVATAASRSTRASIQVTSAADFAALLARSGLGPNGENEQPAVANLGTTSLGSTDVRIQDGAGRRRKLFVKVIAALSSALGVLAVIVALRSRRARLVERNARTLHQERLRNFETSKREREEQQALEQAHLERVPAGSPGGVCPTCRRGFSPGIHVCPEHGEDLVPPAPFALSSGAPRGKICPTCGDRFEGTAGFCGKDGTQLVLLN